MRFVGMKICAFFVLAVFLTTMVGCGVSKKDYDALLKENRSLVGKITSLSSELARTKIRAKGLENKNAELEAASKAAAKERDALKAECDKLTAECNKLAQEAASLKAELKTASTPPSE